MAGLSGGNGTSDDGGGASGILVGTTKFKFGAIGAVSCEPVATAVLLPLSAA